MLLLAPHSATQITLPTTRFPMQEVPMSQLSSSYNLSAAHIRYICVQPTIHSFEDSAPQVCKQLITACLTQH